MEVLYSNMMKFMLDFFRVGKWLNASIFCALRNLWIDHYSIDRSHINCWP